MRGFLFYAWNVATLGDSVAGFIAAVILYRRRRVSPFAFYFSLLLFSLAVEAFVGVLSNYFEPSDAFSEQYIIMRLMGRTVKAIAVWVFVFWLLGGVGPKSIHTTEGA